MTSTLSGLDVAPNHVHWIAEPSFKKADVREVRFYVDGKLSWIDPQKPYMYGGDGGYLVTTWLAACTGSLRSPGIRSRPRQWPSTGRRPGRTSCFECAP